MLVKHTIKLEKSLEMLLNKQVRTMPEDLPTPKKSLKQLEKEKSKQLKKKNLKNIIFYIHQSYSSQFL